MKTALVIGANRGIGLSLVREFKNKEFNTIGTFRKDKGELETNNALGDIDIRSPEVAQKLAAELQRKTIEYIDLLVINAGVLTRESLDDLNEDQIRLQWEVNALAPLRIVHGLRKFLRTQSRVGILTSRMGSVGDNTSGGMYGYRMSKAAVNAAGKSLAIDLAPEGIIVLLLHPGHVRTKLTGFTGQLDPDESAQGLVKQLLEKTQKDSGKFLHANGTELPW